MWVESSFSKTISNFSDLSGFICFAIQQRYGIIFNLQ
jgi:hypothetical protein